MTKQNEIEVCKAQIELNMEKQVLQRQLQMAPETAVAEPEVLHHNHKTVSNISSIHISPLAKKEEPVANQEQLVLQYKYQN